MVQSENPTMPVEMRLSRVLQDIQTCLIETSACKLLSERYEYEYYQENYRLRKLSEAYNVLADENKRFQELIHQHEGCYKEMQECLQSTEDEIERCSTKMRELEISNRKSKQELYSAFSKIDELEAAVVADTPALSNPRDRQKPKLRPISCH
jgi:chromosome segregation ATPase